MGKKAIAVVVVITLMSMFSSISEYEFKQLEQTKLSFFSHENDTVNMGGCTDISATNYNQNATEDDGSCIHQSMGGFEISESIFDEGMIRGLKYNLDCDKYAILQYKDEGNSTNGGNKITVVPTDYNNSVNITEIQLSPFYSPVDFDWSPNGEQFAVMYSNMEVITYNSETGNVSDYLFNLNNSSCPSCDNLVYFGEISYNTDGSLISVMTKSYARFYADDLAYGFVINTSTKEIVKWFSREYGPSTGTWSPDGSHFALQSSLNPDWIIFFNTSTWTWETMVLNLVNNEIILTMDYSSNGEFIALCTLDKLYVYNTSTLAKIWVSDIAECLDIDWSSNSDYLGVTQSYNYGWSLGSGFWGYGDWEWYSDGGSITIYNSTTGKLVDRLTTGNGNLCAFCDHILYFEWHPFSNYIISSGPVFEVDLGYSYPRIDFWIYNESIKITFGCMEMYSANFNSNATRSDGSCIEFDEQDVNQFRENEYITIADSYYDVYWDFCEWDDYEGEFLCWAEDLSTLSEDMIDELQNCDQSENGCETEPYCEEISYGSWGCTYSVPDHFDRPSSNGDLESLFGMIENNSEVVFLISFVIVTCIIVIVNNNKNDTRLSSVLIDNHEDYEVKEEHNVPTPPTSIEINVRELN